MGQQARLTRFGVLSFTGRAPGRRGGAPCDMMDVWL